jgi:hypothetical protein
MQLIVRCYETESKNKFESIHSAKLELFGGEIEELNRVFFDYESIVKLEISGLKEEFELGAKYKLTLEKIK